MPEANSSDRKWLTLLAMTGSLSMIMLDSTVLGVALPSIQRDLQMDGALQSWSVNGYLVAMASWLAIGGRIGDRIGRVWAFRLGMVGFMAASIGCAIAPTALLFVAARVVQGICAATMQPASAAIVVDTFPPDRRGRAMATYAGISLLFLAAGPVIGGALIEVASWHWCFWLNVPTAILSLSLTVGLRPSATSRTARAIDWLSVAGLLLGMPLLVAGLQGVGGSSLLAATAPLVVVGAFILGWFVVRQLRQAEPTIDFRLLGNRAMLADAVILFCMQFINVGQGVYGSLYLQEVLGFTPLEAGAATLPLLVPVLIVIHFAGRMHDHGGPRKPIILGLTLVVVGTSIECAGFVMRHYPTIALGMGVLGCGCGFAMSPANADALSRAPTAQRAEASGIVQTMRQFGSTLGIAMLVTLMNVLGGDGGDSARQAALAWSFSLHIAIALLALGVALRLTPAQRVQH